ALAQVLAAECSRALNIAAVVWGLSRPAPPCPDCYCTPQLVCGPGEAAKEVVREECACSFPWVVLIVAAILAWSVGYLFGSQRRGLPVKPSERKCLPVALLEDIARDQEGDVTAVRFCAPGPRIWHERVILLLPPGALPVVSILTPDNDQCEKDLPAGGDILEFAFRNVPLPAALQGLRDAAANRLRLPLRAGFSMNTVGRPGFAGMAAAGAGVPGLAPVGAAGGVAGLAAALAGPEPAAPGGALAAGGGAGGAAAGLARGGRFVPLAALAIGAAAAIGPAGGGLVPPPAFAGAPAAGAVPALAPAGAAGHVALAGARAAAAAPAAHAAAAAAAALAFGAAPAPVAPRRPADVCVQPVALDTMRNRRRVFRDASLLMRKDAWPDWPIRDPRTVMWALRFIEQ
ncbi:unnamed protein product, partial [Prorocentrum cordatum]